MVKFIYNTKGDEDMLLGILLTVLGGLFYPFTSLIGSFVIIMMFGFVVFRNKTVTIKISVENVVFLGCVLMYFLSCIWGIDRGMNLMGAMKNLSIGLFIIFIMQCTDEEKNKILNSIPYAGAISVIISLIGYFIPSVKEYVFISGRMSGLFGYANTFAIFLLIGIMIQITKEKAKPIEYITLPFNFLGILWSGSRFVFILTILSLAVAGIYLVHKKINRKMVLVASGVFVIIMAGLYFIPITHNVINRLFMLSVNSSTLNGRFLYIRDGFLLLLRYPFGLGANGYSLAQGLTASGLYQVKYVHCGLLQMMLDIGIIPGVMIFATITYLIIKYFKKNIRNYIILFPVLIHGMLDIDFEFPLIVMIMILLLPEGKILYSMSYSREKLIAILAGIMLIYCTLIPIGISDLYYLGDDYGKSLAFFKYNTQARCEKISETDDISKVESDAEFLMEHSRFCANGYQALGVIAYTQNDYGRMCDYLDEEIKLLPYQGEEYNMYFTLLTDIILEAAVNDDYDTIDTYGNKMLELYDLMQDKEKSLSYFGEKIKDKPDFTLSEDTYEVLKTLSE